MICEPQISAILAHNMAVIKPHRLPGNFSGNIFEHTYFMKIVFGLSGRTCWNLLILARLKPALDCFVNFYLSAHHHVENHHSLHSIVASDQLAGVFDVWVKVYRSSFVNFVKQYQARILSCGYCNPTWHRCFYKK